MLLPVRCPAALLSMGLALATGVSAATLAGPSPFVPPAGSADAAPTQDAPIELRGIMATTDGYMFSIYDSAHRISTWLRLNETGREFTVRSHDPARDTVTVEHQGRTLTLALRTAKVASAPAVAPMPVANNAPPPNAPQPIGGPVVLNPTPADEQRRLEAIAAEVNRRRMIRQQALQASRAGGQPPGQPPQGTPLNNQPVRPSPQQR